MHDNANNPEQDQNLKNYPNSWHRAMAAVVGTASSRAETLHISEESTATLTLEVPGQPENDFQHMFTVRFTDNGRTMYESGYPELRTAPNAPDGSHNDANAYFNAWHALVSFVGAASEEYTGSGQYGQDTPADGWMFDTARAGEWCYLYEDDLRQAVEARYGPTLEDARSRAYELGDEQGRTDGSWVIDGRTDEQTKHVCIQLDNAGSPLWFDYFGPFHEPLSGEYTDDWTPTALLRRVGYPYPERVSDVWLTDMCDMFEQAHHDAYVREVVQTAGAMLTSSQ